MNQSHRITAPASMNRGPVAQPLRIKRIERVGAWFDLHAIYIVLGIIAGISFATGVAYAELGIKPAAKVIVHEHCQANKLLPAPKI